MKKSDWFSEIVSAFKSYLDAKPETESIESTDNHRVKPNKSRSNHRIINPASGLPMAGSFDIHGNPYGVPDAAREHSHSSSYDPTPTYSSSTSPFDSHHVTTNHSHDYYNDPFRNY